MFREKTVFETYDGLIFPNGREAIKHAQTAAGDTLLRLIKTGAPLIKHAQAVGIAQAMLDNNLELQKVLDLLTYE
jgi:hypothetical protein